MDTPPKRIRSKTGCLTCRRRKKKCDETKPQCKACVRLKLECEWPTLTPSSFNKTATNSIKQLPSSKKHKTLENTRTKKEYISNTVDQSKSTNTASPDQYTDESTLIANIHMSIIQDNAMQLLSMKPNTTPMVSSTFGPVDPAIISASDIRDKLVDPDTPHYSSDEGNIFKSNYHHHHHQQGTLISTSNSINHSSNHHKSNYYLKKIAMQEDCVENESISGSSTITASPAIISSSDESHLQSTLSPASLLEPYINPNAKFDYSSIEKKE